MLLGDAPAGTIRAALGALGADALVVSIPQRGSVEVRYRGEAWEKLAGAEASPGVVDTHGAGDAFATTLAVGLVGPCPLKSDEPCRGHSRSTSGFTIRTWPSPMVSGCGFTSRPNGCCGARTRRWTPDVLDPSHPCLPPLVRSGIDLGTVRSLPVTAGWNSPCATRFPWADRRAAMEGRSYSVLTDETRVLRTTATNLSPPSMGRTPCRKSRVAGKATSDPSAGRSSTCTGDSK